MPKPKPNLRLIESPIDYAGHPPTDLTPEARTLVARAFKIAVILRASHLRPEHLLLAFASAPCTGRRVLCRSLLRPDDRGDSVFFKPLLRSWRLTDLRRMRAPRGPRVPLDHPARVIFQRAVAEAQAAGSAEIDTEHIAFAWMRHRRMELLRAAAEFRRTYRAARRQFAEYQRAGRAATTRRCKPRSPKLVERRGTTVG
jgi:ATP-dependent Clp protease ATP-binding subunit ClpA